MGDPLPEPRKDKKKTRLKFRHVLVSTLVLAVLLGGVYAVVIWSFPTRLTVVVVDQLTGFTGADPSSLTIATSFQKSFTLQVTNNANALSVDLVFETNSTGRWAPDISNVYTMTFNGSSPIRPGSYCGGSPKFENGCAYRITLPSGITTITGTIAISSSAPINDPFYADFFVYQGVI